MTECFKVCIADLNRKATLEKRTAVGPGVGGYKASVDFTVVFTGWFKVTTLGGRTGRGTARFAGVNVNKNATHIYTTRWRDSIKQLDGSGEHFVRHSDRLFRVVEIVNLDEKNEWLLFQCTERGLDTKDASNA